jgi:hypothetical protein
MYTGACLPIFEVVPPLVGTAFVSALDSDYNFSGNGPGAFAEIQEEMKLVQVFYCSGRLALRFVSCSMLGRLMGEDSFHQRQRHSRGRDINDPSWWDGPRARAGVYLRFGNDWQ